MNLILFDGAERTDLLPLTYTRPTSEIRIGILTIREKWEKHLDTQASYYTTNYLSSKFPITIKGDNLMINGTICPSQELVTKLFELQNGEGLYQNDLLIACKVADKDVADFDQIGLVKKTFDKPLIHIDHLWKIFLNNGIELENDFKLVTDGRSSANLSSSNTLIGENIFIEDGCEIEGAIINSSMAPVYIGKNAKILEGSTIRNGLSLGEGAVIKMGAKIYGATTIGPQCKVGGEVSNSVLFQNSNKGHDGYLGNAVLGEWCNLGADTNNSNLKNNYDPVRLWNYNKKGFIKTGETFCGLFMGDHSKSGINTMFNTGTIVGVSSNIFGAGFPRNYVPSFSWGGSSGYSVYNINKALKTAEIVMARRNVEMNEVEENILRKVFELTEENRNF